MGRAIFSFKASSAGVFGQLHPTAQKTIFIQITKDQIGVRHCHFIATHAVTNRPGARARALRSDFEQSGFRIDPDDAPATRADRLDPNFGKEQLIAHEDRLVIHLDRAVANHPDLECRSAHVRRQNIRDAEFGADEATADDSRGRTGLDRADGVLARIVNPENPAVSLHDQRLTDQTFGAQKFT